MYLGWTRGVQADRYFYWRQLRDLKGSAVVERMSPFGMTFHDRMCGWTLARALARSGDPIVRLAAPLPNTRHGWGQTRQRPAWSQLVELRSED
ncbi:MAG TPA: DUF2252 family protein [Propionibacteriaceae bacterium]